MSDGDGGEDAECKGGGEEAEAAAVAVDGKTKRLATNAVAAVCSFPTTSALVDGEVDGEGTVESSFDSGDISF